MLLIRVMKITSLLFLAMTFACNSGSKGVPESAGVTGVSGVDADGLFGVVRKTYYHLDSSTTASIVDFPIAATKAQRYTFDSSVGLKAEGEISLDLIRASVDGKSITVVGSSSIYEMKLFKPEQLAPDRLSSLQSQVKTICIGSPFSKDTLIGTTGFNEIQFIQKGSSLVVNAFDQNGFQQIAASYLKEENANETIYHVPEVGDFRIRLDEPSPVDSQFFHTLVGAGQWSGVDNLYCHDNRSPVVTAGVQKETFTASATWTVPSGVTSVTVECWGGGGGGGAYGGEGGGGGAYSRKNSIPVTSGATYTVNVGSGGLGGVSNASLNGGSVGGDSWFSTQDTVLARGGGGGAGDQSSGSGIGGSSGSGVGDTKYSGGNGSAMIITSGGGGGSSAGTASSGVNAGWSAGAIAPIGGGNGGGSQSGASIPGGGGGGGDRDAGPGGGPGASGGAGQVIVSWN